MHQIDALTDYLQPLGRVLLGYSGGVDSALLAVVAARSLGPDRFLAVLGVSPALGVEQRRRAVTLAGRFGIPLRQVATDELTDPDYRANGLDRCYHCKRTLWRHLGALASAEGWETILDGTNADDLTEHRPGARAGAEASIRTPLADLGWRKADVRAAARHLAIPGWDAPASPCLASRIRTALPVTANRLGQVESAERWLREAGVAGDLRVRHHGETARIEVAPAMFGLVDRLLPELSSRFAALGFRIVERDARGYRRGSLTVLAG